MILSLPTEALTYLEVRQFSQEEVSVVLSVAPDDVFFVGDEA